MIGEQRLHVLTQAPYPDDRAGLPNGVYITRTYTDLEPGSRRVAVVVRNMTSRPIHLTKGNVVARVQAANLVPEATPSPELWKSWELTLPPRQTTNDCEGETGSAVGRT